MSGGVLEQLLAEVRALRAEVAELRGAGARPGQLVTVAAFAEARSIAESTVRAAIADGRLPAVRVGRAVRVRVDAEIAVSVEPKRGRNTASAIADRVLGTGGAR